METLLILSQIIVSTSVIIVWVFRTKNIIIEFEQYGISDTIRNINMLLKNFEIMIESSTKNKHTQMSEFYYSY